MKKMLMAAMLVAMGWVMIGCGSSSTPEGVVEKAFACLESKDYVGYLKLVDFPEKDGKTPDEMRQQVLPLFEGKVQESIEKNGGLKSWEILETTMGEDGTTAQVKTKTVYGNGEEDENTVKLVKKEDGTWMLDSNK